jgi:hypothetical protein
MAEKQAREIVEAYEQELSNLPKVDVGGKLVTLVKDRIAFFRRWYGTHEISTDLVQYSGVGGGRVVVRASIHGVDGRLLSTGHAETTRTGAVKDFPVEIAETKAIGRALATLGIFGGEFASYEELGGMGGLPKSVADNEFIGSPVPDTGDTGNQDNLGSQINSGPAFNDSQNGQKPAEKIGAAILDSLLGKRTVKEVNKLWDLNEPLIMRLEKNDPDIYNKILLAFDTKRNNLRNSRKGDLL